MSKNIRLISKEHLWRRISIPLILMDVFPHSYATDQGFAKTSRNRSWERSLSVGCWKNGEANTVNNSAWFSRRGMGNTTFICLVLQASNKDSTAERFIS